MDTDLDNKESEEDDSTSSEPKSPKKEPPAHLRHKSMMILAEMKPKEQEQTAHEIFAQMRQLKESNEAMGYHDSDSNNNNKWHQNENISTSVSPYIETPGEFITSHKYESRFSRIRQHKHIQHTSNNSNTVILAETASLKQKLENISSSINNIMHDLHQQNSTQSFSEKQLHETITFFQNQLTEIQDQIEDAENDIESNIDVKFIKYQEEIKVNKHKLKSMKKEKKEKEKQQQMKKEKELQNMIDLQRLQIEQLSMKSSHLARHRSYESPETVHKMHHDNNMRARHSAYFALDAAAGTNASVHSAKSLGRRTTLQKYGILQQIETDSNEERQLQETTQEDIDEHEIDTQYIYNNNNNNHHLSLDPGMRALSAPNARSVSPDMIPYNYDEGQYQIKRQQTQRYVERPMLSDNAIKIMGGFAIVLAGLWIISKYIDSKTNNGTFVRGRPRYKR